MIGYVSFGTNDMERAGAFYDALFETMGGSRLWSDGRFVAWGTSPSDPCVCLATPFDNEPATVGNGVMIALRVKSQAEVDAVYQRAIELGGTDEGPPGPRGDSGFYAGYFRDLEGNKLNAYCWG